jgi:hypothetical protein
MDPNAQTNTADRPSAPPPSPPSPTRVLLVEANPGDARLIREFIRETDAGGFDVESAERLAAGRPVEDDVCLMGVGFVPVSAVPERGLAG